MGNNSIRFLTFQGQSIEDSNELDQLIDKQKHNGVRINEYDTPIEMYAQEEAGSLFNAYIQDEDHEDKVDDLNKLKQDCSDEIYRFTLTAAESILSDHRDLLTDFLGDDDNE